MVAIQLWTFKHVVMLLRSFFKALIFRFGKFNGFSIKSVCSLIARSRRVIKKRNYIQTLLHTFSLAKGDRTGDIGLLP